MTGKRPNGHRPHPKGDPHAVLSWDEVATLFNQRHRTSLTRARVAQVGVAAIEKVRRELRSLCVDESELTRELARAVCERDVVLVPRGRVSP